MSYENIRFNKPNMAIVDSYFYMLDENNNTLLSKVDDGETAFQYPTDFLVGNTINSLQYDGHYFWSLQDITDGISIKQWEIDNYICRLKNAISLVSDDIITYDANTFAIEHYITVITSDYGIRTSYLTIDEYYDNVVTSGIDIVLGPNKNGFWEEVTVSGILNDKVYFNNKTKYIYEPNDQISITKSIFLFNNYFGQDSSEGSLIRLSPFTGAYLSSEADVEYKDVTAATFYRFQNILPDHPDAHALIYIKGSNGKIRNMSDLIDIYLATTTNESLYGNDGSSPEGDVWTETNGNPIIKDNKLFCSTVSNGHDSIQSNYNLLSDFNIQVSGTINGIVTLSGTSEIEHYVQLNFLNNDTSCGIKFNYMEISIPNDSLVLYYPLDGTAEDFSGNAYDGTMHGPTLTSNRYEEANKALYFDGDNDYIALPYYYNTSSIGPFTLSAWVKVPPDGGGWAILDFDRSEYYNCAVGDTIVFNTTNASNNISDMTSNTSGLQDDQWHNIIWLFDGSTKYIYIDGVLDSTQNVSSIGNGVTRYGFIGDGSEASSFDDDRNDSYFKGSIDDLRLYNRVLTSNELKAIFNDIYYEGIYIISYNNQFPVQVFELTENYDRNYLFNIYRNDNQINFQFKSSISGTLSDVWIDLGSISNYDECKLSMGLYSKLATISGSYLDPEYISGNIRYSEEDIPLYGVANLDNIKSDQSTLINVTDITSYEGTLYRLQSEATYYGSDNDWSTYNYQTTPIRPFIDFITVGADPVILPANGKNVTVITAVVQDQYGNGAINKPVEFIDDNDTGYITIPTVYTDNMYDTGKAVTVYKAGLDVTPVIIEGTVTQYD